MGENWKLGWVSRTFPFTRSQHPRSLGRHDALVPCEEGVVQHATIYLWGHETMKGRSGPSHLVRARHISESITLTARLDKLESLIVQQQNQIHQLSSNQIASGPSPQEVAAFRSPPILQTPHTRAETALFLQKPTPTFPSQSAIQSQFGASINDGRPVTGNGYHGQADDMQQGMGGMQRDAFTPYNDQYAPAMSRALGQAEADFPPYDLLYGLVDLFFSMFLCLYHNMPSNIVGRTHLSLVSYPTSPNNAELAFWRLQFGRS